MGQRGGIGWRQVPQGALIPFHLSSSYRHKEHRGHCFVNHLCDAAKLYNLRRELRQELSSLQSEQVDMLRDIAGEKGALDLTAKHPELNEFDSDLRDKQREIQDLQHRISGLYATERAKREQLDAVTAKFQMLMTVVYDTADPFCTEVAFGERECELEMDLDMCTMLQLAKQCTEQLDSAQERLKASREATSQRGLSTGGPRSQERIRGAAANALQALRLCRDSLDKCHDELMQEHVLPRLGAKADAVYFCTAANMEKLQSQAAPQTTAEVDDGNDSLELQPHRSTEGRPRWALVLQHGDGPANHGTHTSVPSETVVRLARRIRERTMLVQARQNELDEIRDHYFNSLCDHLFAFPSSSRERYDQMIQNQGRESFAQTSGEALARLQEAQSDLFAVRRDMRRHIDRTWQPSVPSLGGRTSDYNTPSAPAELVEKAHTEVNPQDIRKWCAGVAREVDPTEEIDHLANLEEREVVDLSGGRILSAPLRTLSDTMEWDDTPEHWARKQKWKAKAKEIGIRPDAGISGPLRPIDV